MTPPMRTATTVWKGKGEGRRGGESGRGEGRRGGRGERRGRGRRERGEGRREEGEGEEGKREEGGIGVTVNDITRQAKTLMDEQGYRN